MLASSCTRVLLACQLAATIASTADSVGNKGWSAGLDVPGVPGLT